MKKKTKLKSLVRSQCLPPVPSMITASDVGRLLSVPEAAALLGIRPATIRSWILHRDKIEVVKIGRCVRITERSITALINSNLISPKTEPRKV